MQPDELSELISELIKAKIEAKTSREELEKLRKKFSAACDSTANLENRARELRERFNRLVAEMHGVPEK